MQIVKTEGIIIGDTNYSESSKILKILTKDYGLISVISKGCRNLKSKLRSISNKLVYANFQIYYKENGISTLISADIIDTLLNISNSIEKISFASYLMDLTHQAYKNSYDGLIYINFIEVLKKINSGFDCEVLTYIYEIKLLDFLGIKPVVDYCTICGNDKNILTISIKDGGYVCQNCYHSGKIYSSKTIKLIRMFLYVDIKKITKIDVSKDVKLELEEFITDYYDEYSGLYLKSRDFLKNLVAISN